MLFYASGRLLTTETPVDGICVASALARLFAGDKISSRSFSSPSSALLPALTSAKSSSMNEGTMILVSAIRKIDIGFTSLDIVTANDELET
jgi:hypothetical protein